MIAFYVLFAFINYIYCTCVPSEHHLMCCRQIIELRFATLLAFPRYDLTTKFLAIVIVLCVFLLLFASNHVKEIISPNFHSIFLLESYSLLLICAASRGLCSYHSNQWTSRSTSFIYRYCSVKHSEICFIFTAIFCAISNLRQFLTAINSEISNL